MSIKTFISEYQDYLFVKNSYLDFLNLYDLSTTNVELAFKQTEELLNEFKVNLDFLEKEGLGIYSELNTIFTSLENKINKITNIAEAIINTDTLEGEESLIKTLHIYDFDTNLKEWDQTSKGYKLPAKSVFSLIRPYASSVDNIVKKGVSKFSLSGDIATKYINISKDFLTNVENIIYLDSNKKPIISETILDNTGKSNFTITIPDGTRLIYLEYTFITNSVLEITPFVYQHKQTTSIPLDKQEFKKADILTYSVKKDIPFGCYAQLKMCFIFKDINKNILDTCTAYLGLDSDTNVIKKYKDVTQEELVLSVWSNQTNLKINNQKINAEDFVLVKPYYDTTFIELITENSFKINKKSAAYIEVVADLELYSLLNNNQSPIIYTITGLTKNVK